MSDDYGACVVLLLEPNDLPDAVVGGQHVTLLYFGEEALSKEDAEELRTLIEDYAFYLNTDRHISVEGLDRLGEERDAVVVLLDPSQGSPAVRARNHILQEISDELLEKFKKSETYPVYTPHMTLGYISEGFDPNQEIDIPGVLSVRGIGIWNGEDREEFTLEEDVVAHIGVERRSGRYPWGSGDNPYQRNKSFLNMVDELHKKGLTQAQIAESLGMTSRELRARKSIAKTEKKQSDIAHILEMKSRGMSNIAIAEKLEMSEGQVRRLLDPVEQAKSTKLDNTVDQLKKAVEGGYLDFGEGTETHLGISKEHLQTAVKVLEEQGYSVHHLYIEQLGTGDSTTLKVLAPPGTVTSDIYKDLDAIKPIVSYTDVEGANHLGLKPIESVDSSRILVNYAETGGTDKDGLIELRRGVDDISLGESNYAQVRIGVDGTHYLKGMAVYADDLPAGVDIRFNTNKSSGTSTMDTLKPMKDDPDNPFGASVYQKVYLGKDGKEHVSALNIVNEEGKWGTWAKTLSSQFLSKQSPELIDSQLKEAYSLKKDDYDEIMSLTNPVVKRELLMAFADGADSAAVDLKAHMLPRQKNQVIIPVPAMKETEVYAPNFKNGERVVLVRHPHGGTFEIPELTVNNKTPAAQKVLGPQPKDAIGIHPKVAERLSGADFDGDTVLVIPNNSGRVKSTPALSQLKNFDPKQSYPAVPGMTPMRDKQGEMGRISNLITDMTIKGAPTHEIARAVKHSMVVIDAEKHNLNYKLSAKENGIAELKTKYQGSSISGAATLISRAKSTARIPEVAPRKAKDGGPFDKVTGEKQYVETGRTYTVRDPKTGNISAIPATTKTTKMALAKDAYSLSSGTRVESSYASYANSMKSLANQARVAAGSIQPPPRNSAATKAYATEVASINAKYNIALKNKPLERRAQVVGNTVVKMKKQANPSMDKEELKKVKRQALSAARTRVGASKSSIEFTEKEWAAVQANAISPSKLKDILANANLDQIKKLSMPKSAPVMSEAKVARAKSMASRGYSQADIAAALGVSTSTINTAIA